MDNDALQKLRDAISFFVRGRPKEEQESPRDEQYLEYLSCNAPTVQELELQRLYTPDPPLKITVALCEPRPDRERVLKTYASLLAQTYGDWKLVLALGAGNAKEYGAICDRRALLLLHAGADGETLLHDADASIDGDYQLLISQGDILSVDALFRIASRLSERGRPFALYADEDCLRGGERADPLFKPTYSQITMHSYNLIGRPFAVSRDAHLRAGGWRDTSEEGEYDYALRVADSGAEIAHLPRVLYTRRAKPNPMVASEARNAVESALGREGVNGYAIRGKWEGSVRVRTAAKRAPLVSIIIPGPHEFGSLRRFLESVEEVSTHRAYELLPVTTGAESATVQRYFQALKNNKAARIVASEQGQSLPLQLNAGAKAAKGSVLLFCAGDLEAVTPDWIESMLDMAPLDQVAAVGPKILYPSGAMAHSGLVIGLGGYYASAYQNLLADGRDDASKLWVNTLRSVSAVSGDCMMIPARRFAQCGGFDERFEGAGYDVEFCLRAQGMGYSSVYTPYARLIAHRERREPLEGASAKERALVYDAIRTLLEEGDPYYNVNFDYGSFVPTAAVHPEPALLLNLKLRGVTRE